MISKEIVTFFHVKQSECDKNKWFLSYMQNSNIETYQDNLLKTLRDKFSTIFKMMWILASCFLLKFLKKITRRSVMGGPSHVGSGQAESGRVGRTGSLQVSVYKPTRKKKLFSGCRAV